MLRVAILCAQGLGDALLMMIPAYHFMQQGHFVTFYHDQGEFIQPLFPKTTIFPYPHLSLFPHYFKHYDLILVENDHSERAWTLLRLRDQKQLNQITFLFPTRSKHPIAPRDYLFDHHVPVATNLQRACQKLLQMPSATKENGLLLPNRTHHLYPHRIALHPTSKDPKRNWTQKQFIQLAARLKTLGYDPYFTLNEQEASSWHTVRDQGFHLFVFTSLTQLSCFLYESKALIGNDSGLGHLASNLGIPTLTISGNPKRVRLWRPDWSFNRVVTLPFNLPNWKGIKWNFREKYWQNFVTVGRVLDNFKQLLSIYSQQKGFNDT